MTVSLTMARLPFSTCLLLLLLSAPSLVSSAALGKYRHEVPNQRSIMFKNHSGRRVDVLWINVFEEPDEDGKQLLVSNSDKGEGYAYGSEQGITSYIGHEFEVQEMPAKSTGKCLGDECRTGYFKVNDEEDQSESKTEIIVAIRTVCIPN
jgi:hypothetical protein